MRNFFCLFRAMSVVLLSCMTAIFVALVPGILFKFPKQGSTLQVAIVHGGLFIVAYILVRYLLSSFVEGFASTCPTGYISVSGLCMKSCPPPFKTIVAVDGTVSCQCANGNDPDFCKVPACGCPKGMKANSGGICECTSGTTFDPITKQCVGNCTNGMASVTSKFGMSCICDPREGMFYDSSQNKCVSTCSSGTSPAVDPASGLSFCRPSSA